mmetsp:Transcript_67498/g.171345  ORF Transcript_67498/g.171345 Transcript_67498/m.171345 type:complete len:247 (-) Transcript_67498:124-864(-)
MQAEHDTTRGGPLKNLSCLSLLLPQTQVVLQQLHGHHGVVPVLRIRAVELLCGLLEGRAGRADGGAGVAHDLVLEDREVEAEAESHGVHGQEMLRRLHAGAVGPVGALRDRTPGLTLGKLREVPVVVTLHLQEEALRLRVRGAGHEPLLQQGQDLVADLLELCDNLRLVAQRQLCIVGSAILTLRLGGEVGHADGLATLREGVLEGGGEHVALLRGERPARLNTCLHELCHVVVAPRTLGHPRQGE